MRYTSLPALVAVSLGMLLSSAAVSEAGIILPPQVGFDAKDLERSLMANRTSGTSSAPSSSHLPTKDDDQKPDRSDQLKAALPTGSSTSTSTSSSTGGAAGSGIVLCLFNNTITIGDDSSQGRLPKDHGLSLPDPLGTDLLRPPRMLSS